MRVDSHHDVFFKTSEFQMHPKIKEFLTTKMKGNPFNKYCLDCKKKKTTHFLVEYGIFVCKDCAHLHQKANNFAISNLNVKHVLKEHWDDY